MRHRKAFSYPFFRKTSPFVHLSRVLTPSPAFHAAKLKQPSVAELSLVMLSTASMNAFLILLLSCWRRARASLAEMRAVLAGWTFWPETGRAQSAVGGQPGPRPGSAKHTIIVIANNIATNTEYILSFQRFSLVVSHHQR